MADGLVSANKETYHHGNLRSVLLQSARQMLEEEGIAALRLRAITRVAGVSPTAAAPHFGNLRGLLTALATQGFEELSEALSAPENHSLRDAGLAYVRFALRNSGLFTLMFRSDAIDRHAPAFTQATEHSFSVLRRYVAARDKTPLQQQEQQVILAVMWAKVHGLAVLGIDGLLTPLIKNTATGDLDEFMAQALDYMSASS